MSALQDVFELSVIISAVDKFTAPMRNMQNSMKYSQQGLDQITKSMKQMGMTSSEIDKVTGSLNKLEQNKAWSKMAADLKAAGVQQDQIDKMAQGFDKMAAAQERAAKAYSKFQSMTVTGTTISVVGYKMGEGLAYAAEKAGELQLAVKGVGTAMKLNDGEMQKLSNMSMTLGIPTMFDSVTTSKIIGAMYTAGLSKDQVLDPKIAQQYVNFADVQAGQKHEDPTAAVTDAATMAHSYQLYSAEQITPFLNNLNAILMQSHQTVSEFRTQYAYIASQALKSGMSSTDALDATAWIQRMGIGGGKSGGTSFADFLMRSYFGSSGQKADDAMVGAGLVTGATLVPAHKENGKNVAAHYAGGHSVFFDDNGKFVGMDQASQIMQNLYKKYNGNMNELNPIIQAIWGTQGGRVASALMNPGSMDQWHNIQNSVGNTADVNTMQESLNKTLPMQWTQFRSTLTDIAQAFGQQLIPILMKVLGVFNEIAGKFLEFELAHPKIVKFAAVIGLVMVALMLIIGPIIAVIGAIGMMTIATGALDVALGPIILIVGAIVVAIIALLGFVYMCIYHFDVLRQKATALWTTLTNNPILFIVTAVFAPFVLAIVGLLSHWDEFTTAISDGWGTIKNAFIDGANAARGVLNSLIDDVNYAIQKFDSITGAKIGAIDHLSMLGGKVETSSTATAKGLTDNQARRAFGMVNGSHAAGLGYVPFDGYIAELHKGEMVLTAQQAASMRSNRVSSSVVNTMNKVGGGGGNVTINIQPGAIQIDGAGQQSGDIVDEIFSRLGTHTRQLSMSRPFGPNRQVFG